MTLPTIGYVNAPHFFASKFSLQRYVTNKKRSDMLQYYLRIIKKNYKYGYKSCKTYKSIKKDRSKDIHMFMTVPWVIFIPFFFTTVCTTDCMDRRMR